MRTLGGQVMGKIIKPILKWAGGKRQIIDTLVNLAPENITVYSEPFVGGGALFFHLQPKVAYINDINGEIIQLYKIIKNHSK